MNQLFFDNWESIVRTLVITILSYVALIALLRGFGKRTLSKMNAFDFIVTIALGSTLATVMLNKDVALADGVLAFFLLMLLQYIITSISVRYSWFNQLVKASPALLVYEGEFLRDMMKKERINEDEIYAAIRGSGCSSLQEVAAVILETNGGLTVIKSGIENQVKSMKNIRKPDL